MRRFGRASAALALTAILAGAASALPPLPPFQLLLEICAKKAPPEFPAAASSVGATPMPDSDIDLIRLNQSSGIAYAILHAEMDQAKVDAEDFPGPPDMAGWRLGDATLVSFTQNGERACTVTASGDWFDTALGVLRAQYGYGEPERLLRFGQTRLAAWQLKTSGPLPGVLLLGGVYGDGRKPISIQILSK